MGLGSGRIALHQRQLTSVFKRAAVLRIQPQRGVVVPLRAGQIGRGLLAQRIAHQVVPVGVGHGVEAAQFIQRRRPLMGLDLPPCAGQGVGGGGGRARGCRVWQRIGGQGGCGDQAQQGGSGQGAVVHGSLLVGSTDGSGGWVGE